MADANNIGSLVLERGDGSITISFINGGRRSTLTAREARLAGEAIIKMADETGRGDAYADPPMGTPPAPRIRERVRIRSRGR